MDAGREESADRKSGDADAGVHGGGGEREADAVWNLRAGGYDRAASFGAADLFAGSEELCVRVFADYVGFVHCGWVEVGIPAKKRRSGQSFVAANWPVRINRAPAGVPVRLPSVVGSAFKGGNFFRG